MSQVELSEAAADLAGLVARARDGEEVVIVEGGHAVAKLVALEKPRRVHPVQLGRLEGVFPVSDDVDAPCPPPRRLGVAEGKFKIPDDFDAPLPDDLLDLFYNGPIFPRDPKTASTSPREREDGRDKTRDGS